MKRRIADLIQQAHFQETEGVQNGGKYIATHEDLEWFAELIIQECAQQLEANRMAIFDANQHHEYWNCGVKWAVAKLRDHFAAKMKYIDCASI